MISFWIIQMGPKSNNKCPEKRQKKRTDTEMRPCENGSRDGSYADISHRNARSHQKLEETREDSLLEPSRESKARLTSWFQTFGLRDGINIYCFKPPSQWRFVTTAPGHDHREFVMKMQPLKASTHSIVRDSEGRQKRTQRHFSFRTLTYRSPFQELGTSQVSV